MEPDWDLHAVVRGFTANNNTTANAAAASKADQGHTGSSRAQKQADEQKMHGFCSTNLAMAENLHGLYKPILLDLGQTSSVQPTISSYMAALQAYKKRTHQQNKELQLCGTKPTSTFPKTNSADQNSQTTKKPKRRKDQPKKVCHVPAEALSSDIWSWRKYGQKPIKGSPYPRSYYKCSSSKSCLARKQVERNRSDPAMFIVTYAAEHKHPAPTHKNSLAGTTRSQNPLSSTSSTAHDVSILPTSKHSSSSSTPTMSPEGSVEDEVLQQSNEIESMSVDIGGYSGANLVDDLMEFSNMDLTNYFFQDLDEIAGPPMDSLFSVQTPPSFPW